MAYDEKFMKMAIEIARRAVDFDEVPVGAVIVKNGEVVGVGENHKERENNAVCHAEIVAISDACKRLNNWWLEDCEMYVTLEPCAMCSGAMINSRIKALYFGAYDEKSGACGSKVDLMKRGLFNHNIIVEGGHMREDCAMLLSAFFRSKR